MLYLSICRLINIDISQGYLFRATNKTGHVSVKPFIGSSVYNPFKQYLKGTGVDGGETLLSLRAGCSITLELLGVSKSAIAKHLGWRSSNMVDDYNDLEQIVRPGHIAKILSSSASSQASSSATQDVISSYQAVNEPKNFKLVFPHFLFVFSFAVLWLHIMLIYKDVQVAINLFELWGELRSFVYFVVFHVGSFVTQPSFREAAAAGLASSRNLFLPGAFGSDGTQ